ncbi:hypothetical protein TrRE_jg2620 [Triparma retinervis]|uniref:Reverse transcriptase domain-containing protein n=1 Tax=Triparma retinervis TaxID=2557542 RepID=A0A9W7FVQ4_9STRA|nr:hypothetical protein TrRE_jg2620 [Triparma retinervis]
MKSASGKVTVNRQVLRHLGSLLTSAGGLEAFIGCLKSHAFDGGGGFTSRRRMEEARVFVSEATVSGMFNGFEIRLFDWAKGHSAVRSTAKRCSPRRSPEELHLLRALQWKEVSRGWAIALPRKAATRMIPNLRLSSSFTVEKWVDGRNVGRPIVNFSGVSLCPPGGEPCSLNEASDHLYLGSSDLGNCLSRLLTDIIRIAQAHPGVPLVCNKVDIASAYYQAPLRLRDAPLAAYELAGDPSVLIVPLRVKMGMAMASFAYAPIGDAIAKAIRKAAPRAGLDCTGESAKEGIPFLSNFGINDGLRPTIPAACGLIPGKTRKGEPNVVSHTADSYIDDLMAVTIAPHARSVWWLQCHKIWSVYEVCEARRALFQRQALALEKLPDARWTQKKIFLGVDIDLINLTAGVHDERARKLRASMTEILPSGVSSIPPHRIVGASTDLRSTIGALQFVSQVRPFGAAYMKHLYASLSGCPVAKPRGPLLVTEEFAEAWECWAYWLTSPTPQAIAMMVDSPVTDVLFTDAAGEPGTGMGGFLAEGSDLHCWDFQWDVSVPPSIASKDSPAAPTSINDWELLALIVGVKQWRARMENRNVPTIGRHLRCRCDNASTVAWVNKGWCASKVSFKFIQELEKECAEMGCRVSASHIPGEENEVADYLSREFSVTDPAKLDRVKTFASSQAQPLPSSPSPRAQPLSMASLEWIRTSVKWATTSARWPKTDASVFSHHFAFQSTGRPRGLKLIPGPPSNRPSVGD